MRSRNLKPGFFKNEELAEMDPLGRLLFQGLWCLADREGRLEDRPKRIKAEILPYDSCSIDKLLNALHTKGFIIRYSINDNNFIQITTFSKHQSPHLKEQASTIPAPDMSGASPVQVPDEHGSCPPLTFNLDTSILEKDLSPEATPFPLKNSENGLNPEKLAALWNQMAPPELSRVNLPLKRKPKDLTKIKASLKLNPEPIWWQAVFQRIHDSPFLRGDNSRGWKADFDFVVEGAERIMDGKYEGSGKGGRFIETEEQKEADRRTRELREKYATPGVL
jgi:hypothetical protein